MGVSTDALLLYGLNVGEDLVDVARNLDMYEEGTDYDSLEGEEVYEALDEWLPRSLELVLSGHIDGCPSYFIAAKGHLTANRGYEKEVRQLPKVSKTARAALREFSKQLNLRPCYWLASYTDF